MKWQERFNESIMQVLFALNRVYYPGDGGNLEYARQFAQKPDAFEEKAAAILLPGGGLADQYEHMIKLIDEVLILAENV